MVFTYTRKLAASIVLIFAMVLGAVPAYPEAADSKIVTGTQQPQPSPSAVVENKCISTDKQDVLKLLEQKKLEETKRDDMA